MAICRRSELSNRECTIREVLVLAPLDLEMVAGAQLLEAVGRMQVVRRRAHRRRADPIPLHAVLLLGRLPAVGWVPVVNETNRASSAI